MFKYILSFLFLFFITESGQAQITINSNGKVAMGASPGFNYQLLVNASGITEVGLRAEGTGGNNTYGVQGIADGTGDYNYGIYGKGNGAIWNYGLYGVAVSTAYNYGVYGKAENGTVINYGIRGAASGTNSWAGYFDGNVYATGSYSSSDERFKKNIMALNNSDMLIKITELQPRKYQFLTNEELTQQGLPQLNAKEGKHFGLLAQELEKVFPELVTDVIHILDEDLDPEQRAGKEPETVITKAINYQELTVLLLAAVQELQAEVEALKTQLNQER